MQLYLSRFTSSEYGTLGAIYIDENFHGFTLEDPNRKVKIINESRIPAGTYQILLRKMGGMNAKYEARYGDKHQGMFHLQGVPNFKWVYIHIGNTVHDTSGCILVGKGIAPITNDFKITSSRTCYGEIQPIINAAFARGEHVAITIKDEDRICQL